jgi:S1-C subfamily serine protease
MAFRISGSFGRSTLAFCFSGVWLAVFHLAVAEELVIDPEAIKIDFTKKLVELSASAPIPDRRDLPEIPQGGFALPVAEGAIQSAPEDIYLNCRPAVVIVMAIKKCPDHADCWHGHMEGTGWIASPDGHIVTCHHVIEDAGDKMPESKLAIMTAAGQVYPIREISASDKLRDIAVVRVDTRGAKLPFLRLAKEVNTGETASIISHPRTRCWFFSQGVVSGFRRSYDGEGKSLLMEVSAEFGPGSSGAPVLNRSGAVIGMAQERGRENESVEMSFSLFGYPLWSTKREEPQSVVTTYGCAPLSALRSLLLKNMGGMVSDGQ